MKKNETVKSGMTLTSKSAIGVQQLALLVSVGRALSPCAHGLEFLWTLYQGGNSNRLPPHRRYRVRLFLEKTNEKTGPGEGCSLGIVSSRT
jgi:hypothetical protein